MKVNKRRGLSLIGLAITLLILFSVFNPPGLAFGGGTSVLSIIESSLVPSIKIPLKVRVLYAFEDDDLRPASGVVVRIARHARLTDDEGKAEFLVEPGNHSVVVIWARSRLRPWSSFVVVDRPLEISVYFREERVSASAIEVEANFTRGISRLRLTFKAPQGELVYASDPILYFVDVHGNVKRYPSLIAGVNLFPYYIELRPGSYEEITVNSPIDIAILLNSIPFIPIQIVNSTIREVR